MSLKRKHHDALFPPEELGPVIRKRLIGTDAPLHPTGNFHKRLRECGQQNEKAR